MSERPLRSSDRTRTDLRAEVLSVEELTAGYAGQPVLEDLTFNVRRGEVAGVVALDGRGKSTLVKAAAGLLAPMKGTVRYEGRDVYEMTFSEDQRFRARCGVVLEGGALFQNRSVFDNVSLPLRYHLGGSAAATADHVNGLLDRVGYGESHNAFPWQVSARGRRLAAFARALVREPELLIVDRFFEALEPADWKRLMELVLELNVKNGTSFLLVGELHPTIFQVAERVVVLEGGKLVAHDFKRSLYKIARIKKAFETGEEEGLPTVPAQPAPAPGVAEGPSTRSLKALVEPGEESDGFDPNASDSDLQPVVVVDAPSDADPDELVEKTITMPPSAAEAALARAREQHARAVDEEADAVERGEARPAVRSVEPGEPGRRKSDRSPPTKDAETKRLSEGPISPKSRALDRRALEAALEVARDEDVPLEPPPETDGSRKTPPPEDP